MNRRAFRLVVWCGMADDGVGRGERHSPWETWARGITSTGDGRHLQCSNPATVGCLFT